ncbi:hypothetical protein COCOBI_04-7340 [Coccomyxa sp. Obi]|nr:hypothetical protein COCOBI_04-7340 [Coccomyxa sp. Obi]
MNRLACCLLCLSIVVTTTQTLTPGGPPECQNTYISNGTMEYDQIAALFFPATRNTYNGVDFSYIYTELAIANRYANVTTKPCNFCAGDSPRTPEAGQKILIPPCKWAEGCRAVVPLNDTSNQYDARLRVSESLGVNVTDVLVPYVFSTGDIVGPGQNAYVLPCTNKCCGL